MHPTTNGAGLSEKISDKSADWACKGLLETVSDASSAKTPYMHTVPMAKMAVLAVLAVFV